jgi:hypothetical protein
MKKLFSLLVTLSILSCSTVENDLNPDTQNPINVYVAGQKNQQASYWINNELILLEDSDFAYSRAEKIIVSNNDVYVLGKANATGSNYETNLFWKNGILTNINTSFFNQLLNNALVIDDMEVSGSDVYFIGYTVDWDSGIYSLKTWKNNVPTELLTNNNTDFVSAKATIKVNNNIVYVTAPKENGYFIGGTFFSKEGYKLNGFAFNTNDVFLFGEQILAVNPVTGYYENISTTVETTFPSDSDIKKLQFDNSNVYYSSLFNISKNGTAVYNAAQNDIIITFAVLNDNLFVIEGSNSQIMKINDVIAMNASSGESFYALFVD